MQITQGWTGEGFGKLVYKLEFPEETPSNNTIKGMNRFVYKDLRQRWQGMVLDALNNHVPATPLKTASIIVVRHSSSTLDWDNAIGGLKPMIDCLVRPSVRNPSGVGLVFDDNPDSMPIAPFVHQVKSTRKNARTELYIYDMAQSSFDSASVTLPQWATETDNLMYEMEFPSETPSNNTIKAMSARSYRALRKLWQYRVISALEGRRPKTSVERSGLVIERHCSGQLDWDNAYGGLKPMLDCLVEVSKRNPNGLGLIADDNPNAMPFQPHMVQFKSSQEGSKTKVKIYRLNDVEAVV